MPKEDRSPLHSSHYPSEEIVPMTTNLPHLPTVPVSATPVQLLGPENTVTVCSFCNAHIKTSVKYTVNTRTHIAAAVWALACCLCCIPYAVDSAKNADHYCPNCQRYLGTYQK